MVEPGEGEEAGEAEAALKCPRCGVEPDEEPWERDLEAMSVYFKCSNDDCPVQGWTTYFEEEDVLLLALKEMAK